jgi:hypothetical protein
MFAEWPEDDEVAIFYVSAILGAGHADHTDVRRQVLAASIAMQVFARNPKHPGAAHYIIHALDDPVHAPLALPAAEAYAQIAPASDHALHMPSHIFIQLGLWDRVVASNREAFKAAVDRTTRLKIGATAREFHRQPNARPVRRSRREWRHGTTAVRGSGSGRTGAAVRAWAPRQVHD